MAVRPICLECAMTRLNKFHETHTIADIEPDNFIQVGFTDQITLEWIWMRVRVIDGDEIIGKLENDPVGIISELRAGDEARIKFSAVCTVL